MRFERDLDIHGHHRECDCSLEGMDRNELHFCSCFIHDDDDRIAAAEAKYDQWKEDGGERNQRSCNNS
jgi:hypothetical protein